MRNLVRINLIRLLAVLLAVPFAFLLAQTGPKRESGDAVRRPKKAETETRPEADLPKIPSRIKKSAENAEEVEQGPTFRSDALTVTVDVAVLDNRGRFIPGIPAGNFRVLEDGVPQTISGMQTGEAPMTVCMVIEFSNLFQQFWSFGWQETLTAVYTFVETLRPDDQVAVVAFDLRPEILSDFTNDRRQTLEALARLRVPGFSESNLYDALTDVADRMSDIEGRKAILYIGSGMDTFSKMTFDQARRKLQTAGVPVYALGTLQALREWYDARGWLGPIARLDFLQADNQLRTFSRETGGYAWFPRFFGEYPGIFRQLIEAMRSTYTLTYTPSNLARDGKFRKIKVELVNPQTGEALRITDERNRAIKYQIVAKTGYQAPREVE